MTCLSTKNKSIIVDSDISCPIADQDQKKRTDYTSFKIITLVACQLCIDFKILTLVFKHSMVLHQPTVPW